MDDQEFIPENCSTGVRGNTRVLRSTLAFEVEGDRVSLSGHGDGGAAQAEPPEHGGDQRVNLPHQAPALQDGTLAGLIDNDSTRRGENTMSGSVFNGPRHSDTTEIQFNNDKTPHSSGTSTSARRNLELELTTTGTASRRLSSYADKTINILSNTRLGDDTREFEDAEDDPNNDDLIRKKRIYIMESTLQMLITFLVPDNDHHEAFIGVFGSEEKELLCMPDLYWEILNELDSTYHKRNDTLVHQITSILHAVEAAAPGVKDSDLAQVVDSNLAEIKTLQHMLLPEHVMQNIDKNMIVVKMIRSAAEQMFEIAEILTEKVRLINKSYETLTLINDLAEGRKKFPSTWNESKKREFLSEKIDTFIQTVKSATSGNIVIDYFSEENQNVAIANFGIIPRPMENIRDLFEAADKDELQECWFISSGLTLTRDALSLSRLLPEEAPRRQVNISRKLRGKPKPGRSPSPSSTVSISGAETELINNKTSKTRGNTTVHFSGGEEVPRQTRKGRRSNILAGNIRGETQSSGQGGHQNILDGRRGEIIGARTRDDGGGPPDGGDDSSDDEDDGEDHNGGGDGRRPPDPRRPDRGRATSHLNKEDDEDRKKTRTERMFADIEELNDEIKELYEEEARAERGNGVRADLVAVAHVEEKIKDLRNDFKQFYRRGEIDKTHMRYNGRRTNIEKVFTEWLTGIQRWRRMLDQKEKDAVAQKNEERKASLSDFKMKLTKMPSLPHKILEWMAETDKVIENSNMRGNGPRVVSALREQMNQTDKNNTSRSKTKKAVYKYIFTTYLGESTTTIVNAVFSNVVNNWVTPRSDEMSKNSINIVLNKIACLKRFDLHREITMTTLFHLEQKCFTDAKREVYFQSYNDATRQKKKRKTVLDDDSEDSESDDEATIMDITRDTRSAENNEFRLEFFVSFATEHEHHLTRMNAELRHLGKNVREMQDHEKTRAKFEKNFPLLSDQVPHGDTEAMCLLLNSNNKQSKGGEDSVFVTREDNLGWCDDCNNKHKPGLFNCSYFRNCSLNKKKEKVKKRNACEECLQEKRRGQTHRCPPGFNRQCRVCHDPANNIKQADRCKLHYLLCKHADDQRRGKEISKEVAMVHEEEQINYFIEDSDEETSDEESDNEGDYAYVSTKMKEDIVNQQIIKEYENSEYDVRDLVMQLRCKLQEVKEANEIKEDERVTEKEEEERSRGRRREIIERRKKNLETRLTMKTIDKNHKNKRLFQFLKNRAVALFNSVKIQKKYLGIVNMRVRLQETFKSDPESLISNGDIDLETRDGVQYGLMPFLLDNGATCSVLDKALSSYIMKEDKDPVKSDISGIGGTVSGDKETCTFKIVADSGKNKKLGAIFVDSISNKQTMTKRAREIISKEFSMDQSQQEAIAWQGSRRRRILGLIGSDHLDLHGVEVDPRNINLTRPVCSPNLQLWYVPLAAQKQLVVKGFFGVDSRFIDYSDPTCTTPSFEVEDDSVHTLPLWEMNTTRPPAPQEEHSSRLKH